LKPANRRAALEIFQLTYRGSSLQKRSNPQMTGDRDVSDMNQARGSCISATLAVRLQVNGRLFCLLACLSHRKGIKMKA